MLKMFFSLIFVLPNTYFILAIINKFIFLEIFWQIVVTLECCQVVQFSIYQSASKYIKAKYTVSEPYACVRPKTYTLKTLCQKCGWVDSNIM